MPEFSKGDPPREDNGIHRKLLGPHMSIKEMYGEDEARSKKGLVAMDYRGDIESPSRQELAEKNREPEQ
jgi:hypothetical protein